MNLMLRNKDQQKLSGFMAWPRIQPNYMLNQYTYLQQFQQSFAADMLTLNKRNSLPLFREQYRFTFVFICRSSASDPLINKSLINTNRSEKYQIYENA